jgi:hypothetical protein
VISIDVKRAVGLHRQTVPSELVHGTRPCPAPIRGVKLGTKRKLQGMIAKSFATEVERRRGAKSAASSSSAKTQLVEAKLELVRAAWLLEHVGIVRRFCCLDRVDRVQRDEIH